MQRARWSAWERAKYLRFFFSSDWRSRAEFDPQPACTAAMRRLQGRISSPTGVVWGGAAARAVRAVTIWLLVARRAGAPRLDEK